MNVYVPKNLGAGRWIGYGVEGPENSGSAGVQISGRNPGIHCYGTLQHLSLFQITLNQNLLDRSNREMKKASLAVLDTAKEKLTEYGFHGKVSYEDGEGNPAELILEKSRKDGCDSVVIGSRGLAALRNSSWAASAARCPSMPMCRCSL